MADPNNAPLDPEHELPSGEHEALPEAHERETIAAAQATREQVKKAVEYEGEGHA